jgi:biopolymer transport protein ExbD
MSFSDPARYKVTPALPLTSMLDVLFLLLVFFLTASVFRDQDTQIGVSLPSASSSAQPASQTQIVITLTAEGRIYMGDKAYEPQALKQVLIQLASEYPDEAVVIRADQSSQTGSAVRVLDLVYSAGLRNVYIATTKQSGEL